MGVDETIIIGIGKFLDRDTEFEVDGVKFNLDDDFEKTDLLDKFKPETFKYKFAGHNGVNVEHGDGILWVGKILEYQEAEGNPLSDFTLDYEILKIENLAKLSDAIKENLGVSIFACDLRFSIFKSYH